LSLITLLLIGALRSGRIALERTERISEEASVTSVRNFLRNLLAEAKPIQLIGPDPRTASVLAGGEKDLKFVSGYAPPGQYGGLYLTELHLASARAGPGLFDYWINRDLFTRSGPAHAGEREPQKVLLLKSVAGVELRYFGSQSEEAPPSWSAQWSDPKKLPMLVSLSVHFPPNDPRRWPPLVVALPLAER
jgi:general secretion pathway protein J